MRAGAAAGLKPVGMPAPHGLLQVEGETFAESSCRGCHVLLQHRLTGDMLK